MSERKPPSLEARRGPPIRTPVCRTMGSIVKNANDNNKSTHEHANTKDTLTQSPGKGMQYPTIPRYGKSLINPEELVKETHQISIDYNPVSGRKMLNTYEIVRELGRGEHGKVKLGYDRERNIYAAIKLLDRKEKPKLGRPQGSSTEEKIHREIAILKKCRHPNIVRLLEVLDDEKSRKVYLVLEYCAKGEIRWQNSRGESVLTREQARSVAQNVALGLEYLHLNGIIHRDIKPANLLVSQDEIVKISDFGVSYAVLRDSDMASELELSKTVGTPAFFSPELCIPTEFYETGERKTPPIDAKVDVWAFGVTLYCLLYGRLPFEADNEYELFHVIATEPVMFPKTTDEDLLQANDLVKKLLTKDPKLRPTITEVKHHPWMIKGLSNSQKAGFLNIAERRTINVSNEEVNEAIRGVSFRTRIKQGISRFVGQMRTHKNSPASSTSSVSSTVDYSASPLNQYKNNSTRLSGSSSQYLNKNRSTPTVSPLRIPARYDMAYTRDKSLHSDSNLSLNSVVSVISSAVDSDSPSTDDCSTPIGLMPMQLAEDNSLMPKVPSIENLKIGHTSHTDKSSGAQKFTHKNDSQLLPDLPRLSDDHVFGMDNEGSSSSSSDGESGELTLVVGRNRSRSVGTSGRTSIS